MSSSRVSAPPMIASCSMAFLANASCVLATAVSGISALSLVGLVGIALSWSMCPLSSWANAWRSVRKASSGSSAIALEPFDVNDLVLLGVAVAPRVGRCRLRVAVPDRVAVGPRHCLAGDHRDEHLAHRSEWRAEGEHGVT